MSKEAVSTGDLIIIKSEKHLSYKEMNEWRSHFLYQREEGIILLPGYFSYSVHPQANIQIANAEEGGTE